jgi:type I restriction-modification system DNA methylase subunit
MSHPIQNLIERFNNQINTYKKPAYNEAQTRSDFIIPFFLALGWDVNNEKGVAEAYRPVVHEDILKIGKAPYKRPDYSFRVGGVRKFFVEAKKPAINLQTHSESAYQLRRYGWNAKLSLSIITNFAEFAVYDCRLKPEKDDDPSIGRVLYLQYTDYLESWNELVQWFSEKAVWQGQFDQYAAAQVITKGAIEVDTAFLNEMEGWRDKLAHHLFSNNPTLTQRQLNFVVQQTIDRIVFLRICEDRGIEDYGRLLSLTNGHHIYKRLFQFFIDADDRYNSGLFHFKKEKGREQPDKLTPHLKIGDEVLREIIVSLYYPMSPYEFSVLPADILGQVYERFLGKIIRLTSDSKAIIEEKPEVKKAGGVYYTPSYIVDYIVKQTVGPLLEIKKFKAKESTKLLGDGKLSASRLKILDPACGSGSFLLGAYQFFLDWYLEQYLQEPEKWVKGKKPRLYHASGGLWKLTVSERKRILLSHIYGVDIDSQAVEVTKLSLLLKVLEDEQSVISQLSLFKERVLPDINNNIRCGNSLIGDEFYQEKQLELSDAETQYRVNAFDWKNEFAEVMQAGGFDAVIGNPPYVRIQTLKEWTPLEVEFYKHQYIAAIKGNYDLYVLFVEKGLSLLNERGYLGFILPHKFFNAKYGEALRGLLAKGQHVAQIIHFGDQQVFANATTYTSLLFLSQFEQEAFRFVKVHNLAIWQNDSEAKSAKVEEEMESKKFTASEWHFVVGTTAKKLFERLSHIKIKLENVTSRIFQGLKTGADKIYIVEEIERKSTQVKIYSREKKTEYWLDSDLLHPLVKGGDSKPFSLAHTNRLILFPYMLQNSHIELVSEATLTENYALTWKYLLDNRESLQNREHFKMQGTKWYAYSRHQALDIISSPKIFTPDIAAQASFSLDETGEIFFTGGVAGGYGIIVLPEYLPKYILGLLNSQLLEWFIRQTATQMRGGYYSYEARFIRHLPIHAINVDDPIDKTNHDKIINLVEQMLVLNQKRVADNDPKTQTVLERRIKATDKQIDQLVYTLYDLTAEEIEIVEKGEVTPKN